VRAHIKAHPDQFKSDGVAGGGDEDEAEEAQEESAEEEAPALLDSLLDAPSNPAMLLLLGLLALLLISNIVTFVAWKRSGCTALAKLPADALARVDLLERRMEAIGRAFQVNAEPLL
jgi:hypothetical protein